MRRPKDYRTPCWPLVPLETPGGEACAAHAAVGSRVDDATVGVHPADDMGLGPHIRAEGKRLRAGGLCGGTAPQRLVGEVRASSWVSAVMTPSCIPDML